MDRRASWIAVAALIAFVGWLLWPSADAPASPTGLAPASPRPAERFDATTATAHDIAAPAPEDRAVVQAGANPSDDAAEVRTIRGVVRDDVGGIVGARIVLATTPANADPRDTPGTPRAEVRTDAEGRFRIGCDARWTGPFAVTATADGHAASTQHVQPGRVNEIQLARLVELWGRVTEAGTGRPLRGATVWCLPAEPVVSGVERTGRSFAETDADGHYRVAEAALRRYRSIGATVDVVVECAGHLAHSESLNVRDAVTQVDFTLRPAARLRLQVVDAATGAPIDGAAVLILETGTVATTDAAGAVAFDVGEGMALTLAVRANGYAQTTWTWTAHDVAAATPRVPLFGVATIAGRVVDTHGEPLQDVGVTVVDVPGGRTCVWPRDAAPWAPGRLDIASPAECATDARGEFALQVVPDTAAYRVRAADGEHVPATSAPVTVAAVGSRARVDLTLLRGGTLQGRVRRNGVPWQGTVVAQSARDPSSRRRRSTNRGGHYVIPNVPPGTLRIGLEDPAGTMLQETELTIADGQVLRHDVDWQEAAATITGSVVTAGGAPLIEVRVAAATDAADGARRFEATTDHAGAYRIDCIAGATFTVSAARLDVVRQRRGVAAGSTGVDLVFPEFGRLRLQLVDASTGAPVRGAQATVAWREVGIGAFTTARAALDLHGIVQLQAPVGPVDVNVIVPASGYAARTVTGLRVVGDPEPAPIRVELVRGVDVTIELVGDAPSTLDVWRDTSVFLLDRRQLDLVRGPLAPHDEWNVGLGHQRFWIVEPALLHQRVFFGTGPAELLALAPGRYRLRAFPDAFVFEPDVLDVDAEHRRFTVRWRRR